MYKLNFFFEWGMAEACLWCENDAARARFGSGAVHFDALGLSEEMQASLRALGEEYQGAMDWNDPTASSPWTRTQGRDFLHRARNAHSRLVHELGEDFEVAFCVNVYDEAERALPTVSIGGHTVLRTAALAPMAGVADTAYRQLAAEQGAVLLVSEMISAKGLCYDSKGSADLCRITPEERPMALQLFGSEPEFLARATAMLQEYHPDFIDLNMGCPVQKVIKTGAGSALMRTPALAAECVRAMCREASVPVTVKMRIGWDAEHINAVEFAQAMEEAGAAAITVHGRTKSQLYSGRADWNAIAQVKAAVSIPVIGNGDITCGADAAAMYEQTGCDLVAVGRATYGNPWIFQEIEAHLRGLPYTPPTPEARMAMMLRHIRMIMAQSPKPEAIAIREARKHASWYMAGHFGAAAFRERCYHLSSYAEAVQLAEDFVRSNQNK